ncbi:RodZ domain-containing protein [Roseateles amylovorans]|uniref:DUF4115 domain-containing protein n=1 Tax=Roseateles amylovorans TaxID=2978473 RepID=A0ABY6AVP1_9BURK|nr:RodZ domain-containing protein [Roseateles amylovorans]UXH77067.1 DUF4115 domain-containing protein [Roseateles amylovorans]
MTSTAADEAPAVDTTASTAATPVTAGAALRRARESRGLHIAALAATLKVPQSKLEAIEADRYSELPDATFARALARSMCRALKVEAEPILAMLPRGGSEASLDRVSPGLNQPFRERAASQEPMLSPALLKSPVALGVAGLLIAAVVVYALPSSWIDDAMLRIKQSTSSTSGSTSATSTSTPGVAGTSSEPTSVDAPSASAPVTAQGTTEIAAPLPAQAPTTTTTPTPAPVVSVPASAAGTVPPGGRTGTAAGTATGTATSAQSAAPSTAPSAVPNTAPNTVAQSPAPAGSAPLRVKTSAESWVEVVDARGQVLLSRLLRPGDQVDVNGTAPLKLRVGNVSGTELVFRGQPVDLAARSRDNVARLELN